MISILKKLAPTLIDYAPITVYAFTEMNWQSGNTVGATSMILGLIIGWVAVKEITTNVNAMENGTAKQLGLRILLMTKISIILGVFVFINDLSFDVVTGLGLLLGGMSVGTATRLFIN